MRVKFKAKASLLVIFILWSLVGTELFADGFIIPVPKPGEEIPGLTVKYHRVKVEILNQVAKTSIDQVFINNHSRDIEGIFIFPLPEKAALSEFAMYIGGKRIKGEILDREQARRIYQDIVRKMKDPALLEYIGRNMFKARVYPIPARGEKRIMISYTEILKAEGNLIRYTYPLNTERFSLHPLQEVVLSARIESRVPLSNIYSPSHKIVIRKEEKGKARVSFEGKNIKPDKDFVLYYSLSPDDIGISFMNFQAAEDNYFMLLAAPQYMSQKEKILNKNLVFVLDSSGSMSGKKISQAKEAARFVIHHLDEKDRFSIVDFDDGVETFAPQMVVADPENKQKALDFVKEIEDSGGTNINEALLRALQMVESGEKPAYILFLTDGLPTVGITETAEILKNINRANKVRSRIFVFGVGYDVNTELLDSMATENRGTSLYVSEDENLEMAVSNYYEKISSPLFSDLKLAFEGVEVKDAYPRILPDLFKGSQLILIGKYTGDGPVEVILSGKVGKKEKRFILKNQSLIEDKTLDFLPRLWATRRIGYLLQEIRLHGEKEELVEEIKKLGLKYGVLTPYTSFLVTEKERQALEAASPDAMAAISSRTVTGAGAVKAARVSKKLQAGERASEVISKRIRYKKDKTFYLAEGFWIDSDYQEGSSVKEIRFNSEAYFRLLIVKPGLAPYLSLGRKVIVSYEGVNYKIIE